MPDASPTISYCHSCGTAMDVTGVAPFSNVECPSCGKHTRVKREFGPYTLLRRHAIGGMSVVFVAHDNTLDREVALKILNEDYSSDEKRIAAFEEEARITASISHPHVVRVLTTGRAFERFFIAMELVTGGHFEHQIRERGALPEQEVLPLSIQVAEGLQAAHAAGLIHRDMKPGNILLDAAGNAKIVDFGLSLVTKGGKAQAEEIWATPYYVPPETIEGLEEDFRSDVYAFGATLYHALAGVPSCAEESMVTTILREAKQNVKPLAQVAPWLSPDTCQVVDRAMAYRPEDRFGSYDEMIAALRMALLRAKSGKAVPQDAAALRRQRAERKRKQQMLWGGVAAAVALLGVGVPMWLNSGKKSPPQLFAGGDSLEAVPAADPGNGTDPTVAARIGRRYVEAHDAMNKRDFVRAATELAALRDDPEVQEPTGTWAGVEAVICHFLNGQPSDARKEAVASLKHLEEAKLANPAIKSELSPVLSKIAELPLISPEKLEGSKSGAAEMMAWVLSGLKNWEQGGLRQGAVFFRAVQSVPLKDSDGWARYYQAVTKRYLGDFEKLEAAELGAVPGSQEECEKRIEQYNELLSKLETRGRARFNVREWQLELNRKVRELQRPSKAVPEVNPVNPGGGLAANRNRIEGLLGRCQFVQLAATLKQLNPKPPEKAERDSLLGLAESAAAFLADLEEGLQRQETSVELKSRDGGKTFVKAKVLGPGKLELSTAEGQVSQLGWDAISPDSIIELHRQLVRSVRSELEKLRRHEAAIAFDWLVGDRSRATSAAERLSSESAAFRQRWGKLASGLK